MSIEKSKHVTIISGFLGAGKTTFINALIRYLKNRHLFIVENEFGKEGIDSGLLLAPDSDIFELNSGCLCCNLNEKFLELLRLLWERKNDFDELVIETTGIADPATIAQPFLTNTKMEEFYDLKRVICIVDAQFVEYELAQTEEARKQIVFADIILINKTEMVAYGELHTLKILLKNINPTATVFCGNNELGYPMEELLVVKRNDSDRLREFENSFKLINLDEKLGISKEHHHQGISSISFVFYKPFDLQVLRHRLMIFLTFQSKDIYRVKGLVWAEGIDHKIFIQSVCKNFNLTDGETWATNEKQVSRLVFIGKNLKSHGIQNFLQQCFSGRKVTEKNIST